MVALKVPIAGAKGATSSSQSAFAGAPCALVAPPQTRSAARRGRRHATQAILEKVRETLSPSNGAVTDWKPKSDPGSITADVLQNLGDCSTAVQALQQQQNLGKYFIPFNLYCSRVEHTPDLPLCRVYSGRTVEQDPERPRPEDGIQGGGSELEGAPDRGFQPDSGSLEVRHL